MEGDQANKMRAAGDVLCGRPTLLLALACEKLSSDDREQLLSVLADDCLLSSGERIAIVHRLYSSCGAFETAMKLVDKHQERGSSAR